MEGLGGQQVGGKVVTVQRELPADIDGITDAVRQILLLGEVQSVSLKLGEPIVYERFVRDGEEMLPQETSQGFAQMTPMEIVRNVHMEEFDPFEDANGSTDPHVTLTMMIMSLELQQLNVTHLIIPADGSFWKWFGLQRRLARQLKHFMGARIEAVTELPTGTFLLCGARHRSATLPEITFVLKGSTMIGVKDEAADAEGA